MRNALVVLVPLCFGLTSGFIVPSGIQEISIDVKDDINSIQSSASKSRNMMRTSTEYPVNVYNSSVGKTTIYNSNTSNKKPVNDSLNNDMYEHSQAKDADVQERSFIYINQRSKKPIRQRLYDKLRQRQHVDSKNEKSYLSNINSIFEEFPRQFSIGYVGNKYNNVLAEISSKPDHRCHAKLKDDGIHNADVSSPIIPHEQREYLELLKVPLLRPTTNMIEKRIKDLNKNVAKKLEIGKSSYVIENLSELKEDYPAEIQKGGHDIEASVQTFINDNVHGKYFSLDNTGPKVYYNTEDGDKLLLDSIIKHNLNEKEWRIGNHELNNENIIYCQDCMKKVKKNKLSSKLLIETMCKCGHHMFVRELEKIEE